MLFQKIPVCSGSIMSKGLWFMGRCGLLIYHAHSVCLQGSRAQRAARVLGSLQRCGVCSVPPSPPPPAPLGMVLSAFAPVPASQPYKPSSSGNPLPSWGPWWHDFPTPTPSLWQEAERDLRRGQQGCRAEEGSGGPMSWAPVSDLTISRVRV